MARKRASTASRKGAEGSAPAGRDSSASCTSSSASCHGGSAPSSPSSSSPGASAVGAPRVDHMSKTATRSTNRGCPLFGCILKPYRLTAVAVGEVEHGSLSTCRLGEAAVWLEGPLGDDGQVVGGVCVQEAGRRRLVHCQQLQQVAPRQQPLPGLPVQVLA